jgi:NitT/TauT family transport system ATP-binding protein
MPTADIATLAPPAGADEKSLLSIQHVRQAYPKGSGADLLVLDDINLELKSNEILGLLGLRSGAVAG